MGLYFPNVDISDGKGVSIIISSDGVIIHEENGVKITGRNEDTFISVPNHHGRLIDESEFFARLDNGIKTISSLALPEDFVASYTQLVKEVKEEIGKCRTIIPASEEASA